jgi:hypothetical protein
LSHLFGWMLVRCWVVFSAEPPTLFILFLKVVSMWAADPPCAASSDAGRLLLCELCCRARTPAAMLRFLGTLLTLSLISVVLLLATIWASLVAVLPGCIAMQQYSTGLPVLVHRLLCSLTCLLPWTLVDALDIIAAG